MCRTYYINISTIGEVEGMKTDRMTVQDGFNSQHKTFLSRQLEIFQLFFGHKVDRFLTLTECF